MRIVQLLVPLALIAGCATVQQQEDEGSTASAQTGAKDESVAYGPCAASRATILASVSAGRAAAIARGFTWLDADVPFSMTATHGTYRTDCSGFVSMCWSLRAPGLNTRTLGTSGSGSFKLDSYDDLVPADALVDVGRHAVVFLGWNDAAHNGACVLEQSSTKNDMQFRVRMKAQLESDGFLPMRSDEFANDTKVYTPKPADSAATGTTTPDDEGTDAGTGTKTPAPPTEETTETGGGKYETPVCKSTAVALICAVAYAKGVECGRVIDNCGRAVDCTGMPGFGCGSGETCNENKCTSTCRPKPTADLCYSAQLASGIQCGTVPDGCGGTVDCGELPYFRCGGGATCGSDNKCPATSKPSPTTPDYEECEGSLDDPEICPASTQAAPAKGDSGDDRGTTRPSSTRTASDDEDADEESRERSSGIASSGCSSAPGGSSSGLGAVAIAFFLMMGARRRRAS